MERLALDVNGCFDPAAGGLARGELDALAPAVKAAFDGFEARRRSGELGFAVVVCSADEAHFRQVPGLHVRPAFSR